MSRALRRTQIARRRYPCEWEFHTEGEVCRRPIEPGERYVRASLPPGVEPNYGDSWWTMRYHEDGAR